MTVSKSTYDLACALRGPDDPRLSILKWLFTARIRFYAGIPSVRLGVSSREIPLSADELSMVRTFIERIPEQDGEYLYSVRHYLIHIVTGLDSLRMTRKMPEEEHAVLRDFASSACRFVNDIRLSRESEHLWSVGQALDRFEAFQEKDNDRE